MKENYTEQGDYYKEEQSIQKLYVNTGLVCMVRGVMTRNETILALQTGNGEIQRKKPCLWMTIWVRCRVDGREERGLADKVD